MSIPAPPVQPGSWIFLSNTMEWLQLLLLNSGVAVLLTLVTTQPFLPNLIFSHCIGISIASLVVLLTRALGLAEPRSWIYLFSVLAGSALGIGLALLITGFGAEDIEYRGLSDALRGYAFSLLVGTTACWYFFVYGSRLKGRIVLGEQQLRTAETERQLSETRLQLLQAQIEPHFLFNTLSNVVGLIGSRPDDAREMLEALTRYLRGSLKRSRERSGRVSDEIELLQAYLFIQQIRMGERLKYYFEIDEDVQNLPLAPLLLQPLVENAIRHGLDPSLQNGQLSIRITADGDFLSCSISDDGVGLAEAGPGGDQLGLTNVRQRVQSLYGDSAKLELLDNNPGVCARLRIPLDQLKCSR